MKEAFKKISVVLLLAACELLLGILLLVNPIGLTTAVLIGVGILLIVLGIYNLFHYIRLPREEACKTWIWPWAPALSPWASSPSPISPGWFRFWER